MKKWQGIALFLLGIAVGLGLAYGYRKLHPPRTCLSILPSAVQSSLPAALTSGEAARLYTEARDGWQDFSRGVSRDFRHWKETGDRSAFLHSLEAVPEQAKRYWKALLEKRSADNPNLDKAAEEARLESKVQWLRLILPKVKEQLSGLKLDGVFSGAIAQAKIESIWSTVSQQILQGWEGTEAKGLEGFGG